ncbi:MAG: DUF6515 family protein [Candidatus Omnitrophota bacterium]
MRSKIDTKKILGIFLLVVFLLSEATQAYAQGPGKPSHRSGPDPYYYTPHYAPHGRAMSNLPNDYIRLIMGGLEYYYWEGMFYRMMEGRYVIVSAPIGAVVTTIPQGSQPVIVDGIPYYNINGVTYMYTPQGYQVVPQPKTIIIKNYTVEEKTSAPATTAKGTVASNSEESFTVNIPNSKGGYTAVTLKRSGNGFIGPQGEYYTEFPKIEQLKVMYGK